jgi:protein-disulfide isomerase
MQAAQSTCSYTPAKQQSSPVIVLSLFVIVLAALGFGAWTFLLNQQDGSATRLVPENEPVKGDRDAPVTVVVFADFQCEACSTFASDVLPQLDADFIEKGIVRFAFRHYPLGGKDSVRAAVAAECAGQQGKFWKMHDLLYGWKSGTNADKFPPELVKTLSLGLSVNSREFDACVDDPIPIIPIEDGLRAGFAMGVRTLPAVFVNGVYTGDDFDYTRISALVLNAAGE